MGEGWRVGVRVMVRLRVRVRVRVGVGGRVGGRAIVYVADVANELRATVTIGSKVRIGARRWRYGEG